MFSVPKVAVAIDAPGLREVLASLLAPHCDELIVIDGVRGLADTVAGGFTPSLVLARFDPSDERCVQTVQVLNAGALQNAQLVLLTADEAEEEALAAVCLGAVAFLRSPFELDKLKKIVGTHDDTPWRARRERVDGLAIFADPVDDDVQLSWILVDVSATGAFVATEGPLAIGCQFGITLLAGPAQIHVRAEVVRLQEPGWGRLGGVGVRFLGLGRSSRAALNALSANGGILPTD